MRTPTRRQLIIGGLLVLLVAVLLGTGSFFVTSAVKQVPKNTERVEEIERDRAERIAAACAQRHADYLATVRMLDLIDTLIHQTDLNDPRIPASLRTLQQENRVAAEAAIADARRLAAETDCPTAGRP